MFSMEIEMNILSEFVTLNSADEPRVTAWAPKEFEIVAQIGLTDETLTGSENKMASRFVSIFKANEVRTGAVVSVVNDVAGPTLKGTT